jgi:hypothetical protein
MVTPRDLNGPGQTAAIRDVLQAILIAELLRPSSNLWITYGWISDVEALDNTGRAFGALQPDWPATWIRLSRVLGAVAVRGGRIRLVCRNTAHNEAFLATLKDSRRRSGAEIIDWRMGLLEGSMNLTQSGLNTNDERISLRFDSAGVAQRRLELEDAWTRLSPC